VDIYNLPSYLLGFVILDITVLPILHSNHRLEKIILYFCLYPMLLEDSFVCQSLLHVEGKEFLHSCTCFLLCSILYGIVANAEGVEASSPTVSRLLLTISR